MVIPNELWLKIMSYMKSTDLLKSFNLVCKRFHNLTLDKSAIRDLDIIECKDKVSQEKIVKLLKHSTFLKRLEITDSEIYVNQFLYHSFKANVYLKSLKISKTKSDYSEQNKPILLSKRSVGNLGRSQIEHLELGYVDLTKDVLSTIGKFKTLKCLKILGSQKIFDLSEMIEALALNSKNLEEIDLGYKMCVTNSALNTLFKERYETLRKFQYGYRGKITFGLQVMDDECQRNLSLCQQLEEISILECAEFKFQSANFSNMPKLTKVSIIGWNFHQYPMPMTNILKNSNGKYFDPETHLSNMKYLWLEGCLANLEDYEQFLKDLSSVKCEKLEKLAIVCSTFEFGVVNVTEETITRLLQNCPNLKILKLVGFKSNNISNEWFYKFYRSNKNIFLDIWNRITYERTLMESYVLSKDYITYGKYQMLKDNSDFWFDDRTLLDRRFPLV